MCVLFSTHSFQGVAVNRVNSQQHNTINNRLSSDTRHWWTSRWTSSSIWIIKNPHPKYKLHSIVLIKYLPLFGWCFVLKESTGSLIADSRFNSRLRLKIFNANAEKNSSQLTWCSLDGKQYRIWNYWIIH